MAYSKEKMREYMAHRREGNTYKGLATEAPVLVAVAAGEMSESMAAKLLKTDIFEVRGKLHSLIEQGLKLWDEYRKENPLVLGKAKATNTTGSEK